MPAVVQIKVSDQLYLKDPQDTRLGRNIISSGITLIDEIGFEKFTFKKLAEKIDSTEASIYRYFESKHKLLVYLVSWYWSWIEYLIDYRTVNLEDPCEKLAVAVQVLSESGTDDPRTAHVDEAALHRIVVGESSKAYLIHELKEQGRDGFFRGFESLCSLLAGVICEINPKYKYPKALAQSAVTVMHRQLFYAKHVPFLTELKTKGQDHSEIAAYVEELILKAIGA